MSGSTKLKLYLLAFLAGAAATVMLYCLIHSFERAPPIEYFQSIPQVEVILNKPLPDTLASLVPKGKRAVTVGVTEISGLGGNLEPGDIVDILLIVPNNDEVGVPTAFTVIVGVSVLAVGQNMDIVGREPDLAKSITLCVTPRQAEILTLSSEVGNIRLSLRHPDDRFYPAASGTALTDVTEYTVPRGER